MCVSLMRSAAVVAGVLGGIFGPFAIDSGLPGVAPAQAKEYYTKKRVNGRWVSGRFAKRGAPKVKAKVAARAVPARVAAAPAAVRVTDPKPASAPAPSGPSTAAAVPATPAAPPVVRVDASGSAPARPAPGVAALAEDVRMRKLQEALQARTQSLLVTSQNLLVTSQNLAPSAPSPSSRLQEALQARSRDILVTSLIDPAPAAIDLSGPSETASLGPVRGTLPRAELRSVTFDFVSGVKTTMFGDGTTATEAFDLKLVRELALRRPPTLN